MSSLPSSLPTPLSFTLWSSRYLLSFIRNCSRGYWEFCASKSMSDHTWNFTRRHQSVSASIKTDSCCRTTPGQSPSRPSTLPYLMQSSKCWVFHAVAIPNCWPTHFPQEKQYKHLPQAAKPARNWGNFLPVVLHKEGVLEEELPWRSYKIIRNIKKVRETDREREPNLYKNYCKKLRTKESSFGSAQYRRYLRCKECSKVIWNK